MDDWPEGYSKRVLDQVDSTLNEARRIAPSVRSAEWILAHEQTAARGRRGRAWEMSAGNFAATLLMPNPGSPANSSLRSFIASLALYETFVALTGYETSFALKWPNDVLLNGGKVAGILLETIAPVNAPSYLAIGIGVNLVAAPDVRHLEAGALHPVSLQSELSLTVTPETFLTTLASSFARFENQFQTYGFDSIRTAWLGKAARLGEVITARTVNENYRGVFMTVDEMGQLVLQTDEGRISIPAADVYF